MRKATVPRPRPWTLVYLVLALALGACTAEPPQMDADPVSDPVGTLAERSTLFEGTLPCQDCPGIRYQLLLRPDSVYFLRRSYLGADIIDQDDIGRWYLDTGRRLVRLRGSGEDLPDLRVVSTDTLRPVSGEAAHAMSDSTAALVRREESATFEPKLRMRGMFTYMADAALFRECASEWRIPVAMEAEYQNLERAYSESVLEPGSPLLAEVDGRITTRPAVDREGFEDVLVVERFEGLWPGETCGAQGATASLENTFWGLVRLGSRPVKTAPDQKEVHLRFLPGTSEVRGFGGCNSFSGSFKVEGRLISFGAMASTRMACPTLDQESELFDRLAKATRYVITGDHLDLRDAEGNVLLRFEARYFR